MTVLSVMSIKLLVVVVSSVNDPPSPNVAELGPVTVNPNEPPKPTSDVSLVIFREDAAVSINVHSTDSVGETVTIMPVPVAAVATALPVHVTLARLHPVGSVLSIIV